MEAQLANVLFGPTCGASLASQVCIDCNWAQNLLGLVFDLLFALGAILGLWDFINRVSSEEGFAGDTTYHGDRAQRTGDDIREGVTEGARGTADNPPPSTPTTPTSVPPPEPPPSRGLGGWIYDVVGNDLSKLGRQ